MISAPDAQPSALTRLKELLLSEERAQLARHDEDLERLAAREDTLAERLPGLVERARKRSPKRLAKALSAPVAEALGSAIEQRRQMIVGMLFPVIGPAIRKAIAEALRSFASDFNQALESSLTARGLRWRVESWRTGMPYAQVVLRHTLRYRIDHLFLIEPDSGLVIHRESAPDLADLDSDAIAGMLTAIQQFVRDSVGGDSGTLDTATVGEHVLWVESGPRANLACFIRGVPTEALRLALRRRLERIHERLDDPAHAMRAAEGDTGEFLASEMGLAAIDGEARASGEAAATRRASPWPLRIVVFALLVALAAWWWRGVQWQREVDAFRATIERWPGLVVQQVSGERWTRVRVRALLDPLADSPPHTLPGPAGVPVEWRTRGYVSLDADIVLRRAQRALQPPPSATLAFDGATLRAAGRAPQEWVAAAQQRALLVPGVASADFSALSIPAAGTSAREQLDAALVALRARSVRFVRDTEVPPGDASLDELVAALRSADEQARALGLRLAVRTFGANDPVGSAAVNAALRDTRATWLAERLREALPGLAVAATTGLAADDPRVRNDVRSALIDVQVQP